MPDVRPRCNLPISHLTREGTIVQHRCQNYARRGLPRCGTHADLFAWAARERKVRADQRAKRRARDRAWSLERLATLSETRQLSLLVYAEEYEAAHARAQRALVDARLATYDDAVYPGIDAPRWQREAWIDALERRDAEREAWNRRWDELDTVAAAAAERAVLEHGWPGWGTLRWLVYERDRGICFVCDRPVPDDLFHLGHLQDRMMGGSDRPDNLVVMCAPCNLLRKPLHETPEAAREWAAACRAEFRRIDALEPMSPGAFARAWARLDDAERERTLHEALDWPFAVEEARREMERFRQEAGGAAADASS